MGQRQDGLLQDTQPFGQGHIKEGPEVNFESDCEMHKSVCSAAQNPEGNDHWWCFTTGRQQQDGDDDAFKDELW